MKEAEKPFLTRIARMFIYFTSATLHSAVNLDVKKIHSVSQSVQHFCSDLPTCKLDILKMSCRIVILKIVLELSRIWCPSRPFGMELYGVKINCSRRKTTLPRTEQGFRTTLSTGQGIFDRE